MGVQQFQNRTSDARTSPFRVALMSRTSKITSLRYRYWDSVYGSGPTRVLCLCRLLLGKSFSMLGLLADGEGVELMIA